MKTSQICNVLIGVVLLCAFGVLCTMNHNETLLRKAEALKLLLNVASLKYKNEHCVRNALSGFPLFGSLLIPAVPLPCGLDGFFIRKIPGDSDDLPCLEQFTGMKIGFLERGPRRQDFNVLELVFVVAASVYAFHVYTSVWRSKQLRVFREEMGEKDRCLKSAEERLKDIDILIQSTNEKLKIAEENNQSTGKQLREAKAEIEEKDLLIQSIKEALDTVKEEMEEKDLHIQSTEEALETVKEKMEEKDNHIQSTEEALETVKEEIEEKDLLIQSTKETLETVKKEMEEKDNHIQSTEEALEAFIEEMEEKDLLIQSTKKELEDAKEELITRDNCLKSTEEKLKKSENEKRVIKHQLSEKENVSQPLKIDLERKIQQLEIVLQTEKTKRYRSNLEIQLKAAENYHLAKEDSQGAFSQRQLTVANVKRAKKFKRLLEVQLEAAQEHIKQEKDNEEIDVKGFEAVVAQANSFVSKIEVQLKEKMEEVAQEKTCIAEENNQYTGKQLKEVETEIEEKDLIIQSTKKELEDSKEELIKKDHWLKSIKEKLKKSKYEKRVIEPQLREKENVSQPLKIDLERQIQQLEIDLQTEKTKSYRSNLEIQLKAAENYHQAKEDRQGAFSQRQLTVANVKRAKKFKSLLEVQLEAAQEHIKQEKDNEEIDVKGLEAVVAQANSFVSKIEVQMKEKMEDVAQEKTCITYGGQTICFDKEIPKAGQKVLKLPPVQMTCFKQVYGPYGTNMITIENETGAEIHFHPQQHELIEIILRGESEQVKMAARIINGIIIKKKKQIAWRNYLLPSVGEVNSRASV